MPQLQTPVRDALAAAVDALAAAGVPTPRLDAELLLAEASGRDRFALAVDGDRPLDPAAGRSFAAMVRRRVAREPVAYIVGRKAFRHLDIACDRRALIPRPETELLVDVACELAAECAPIPPRILDVGTGSGAIALAVADEIAGASVVATDASPEALSLAAENAARLGLAGRVRFEPGTLPAGRFDLVLANLPYVSEAEWAELAPEITSFEPRAALVAGPSGREAIETLLGELAAGRCEAYRVAVEVGAGQAAEVADLVRRSGYGRVEVRPDLAGIDRVVLGAA